MYTMPLLHTYAFAYSIVHTTILDGRESNDGCVPPKLAKMYAANEKTANIL